MIDLNPPGWNSNIMYESESSYVRDIQLKLKQIYPIVSIYCHFIEKSHLDPTVFELFMQNLCASKA